MYSIIRTPLFLAILASFIFVTNSGARDLKENACITTGSAGHVANLSASVSAACYLTPDSVSTASLADDRQVGTDSIRPSEHPDRESEVLIDTTSDQSPVPPDTSRAETQTSRSSRVSKHDSHERVDGTDTASAAASKDTENRSPGKKAVSTNNTRTNADAEASIESEETPISPEDTSSSETASTEADPARQDISVPPAIIRIFRASIETDGFLSNRALRNTKKEIDLLLSDLPLFADRTGYIREHRLQEYVNACLDSIDNFRKSIPDIVEDFLAKYDQSEIPDRLSCANELYAVLDERLQAREGLIEKLDEAINRSGFPFIDLSLMDDKILFNAGIIGIGLLLLLIWLLVARKRKRNRNRRYAQLNAETKGDGTPAIVVRRKTTSIMKKQSLEDVIGNDDYMKIECSEFCNDSAVRRIYLKNTCIKEIYNMYAEDLRNPDNPKEDGCMVLGRWVYDDETSEYYVSLEHIVQPGDDAVFQEYELNFGGKIKLKVAEQLRKLRRETNLQYDLTCWVHSHPGLGVFFSNSDSNVQMQLKHPSHPNFLTAIVIDILTPQQDFGIFTFRHDASINSRNDLKRLYSLETLHKWAVESCKHSFRPEDHYNTLAKAEIRAADCYGIELSNGAIIDMNSMTLEAHPGLAGWIYGYPYCRNGRTEYVVKSVLNKDNAVDQELLGCFLIGTHCSIPSIRKAITGYAERIRFILFYSTTEETLTSIPMTGSQPGMDDKYYGEELFENLKIWTRRKR